MESSVAQQAILDGRTALGIELGSTRIKAVLTGPGFEPIAAKIQDLYLSGHQRDATALVPDEMIDAMCLVGPISQIAERLTVWQSSGVDGVLLRSEQPEYFEQLRGLA